ncbi:MAG TPA: GWxTD domain-containing protein [Thermoanaerobaculia bacterium]|nr:GWxTD domain-containing protein [Thermoanaerobaculia bacterium]
MKRYGALLFLLLPLLPSAAFSQTLPELFEKAKAQVKGEDWAGALKTLDALDAEAAKPGNEAAKVQLAAPTAFYRGVCEANMGNTDAAKQQFEAFLKVQPNASLDPSMYSKKAIASFEEARRATGSTADLPASTEGAGSLFTAYQEFKAPPNIGEPVSEKWGDGPIHWIMTSAEKRDWAALSSASERAEFVQKFWASRNPHPGSADNAFETTFNRRVAFADAYFPQDEKQRGSMTDRGMVFIILGPPTYVGRRPLRTGEDASEAEGMSTVGSQDASNAQAALGAGGAKPTSAKRATVSDQFVGPGTKAIASETNWREVWHYRKELLPKSVPYLQVDLDFITRRGYGTNVLQRDPTTMTTLEKARQPVTTTAAAN